MFVRPRSVQRDPNTLYPRSVLVALMTFFHTDIIHWLTPAANRFRSLNGGWAIPIAIIFVLVCHVRRAKLRYQVLIGFYVVVSSAVWERGVSKYCRRSRKLVDLSWQIVLILVGVVWGLGEGFGIAAAGTILASPAGALACILPDPFVLGTQGEIANFMSVHRNHLGAQANFHWSEQRVQVLVQRSSGKARQEEPQLCLVGDFIAILRGS